MVISWILRWIKE